MILTGEKPIGDQRSYKYIQNFSSYLRGANTVRFHYKRQSRNAVSESEGEWTASRPVLFTFSTS